MKIKDYIKLSIVGISASYVFYLAGSISSFCVSHNSSIDRINNSLIVLKDNQDLVIDNDSKILKTVDSAFLHNLGYDKLSLTTYIDYNPDRYEGYMKFESNKYGYIKMDVPNDEKISFYFLSIGLPIVTITDACLIAFVCVENKKIMNRLGSSLNKLGNSYGHLENPYLYEGDLDLMISTIDEASNKIINMDNDIKETYERTIALLDSMPNGLILLDSKRNILLRNRAIEKFYYSIKEQGKDNILLDLKSKIEDCLNQKQSISFDWNVQNIIYSISIEALGEKGTAILVYDVTNQRRIEDTKRDFMVYASHQMKTPLTSVIGYLEMIIDGVVTDEKEVREMTNDALTSAKTLNGMLKDMLSLAKMESNVPLNREKIDLAEMTNVVCNSFKEQCLVKKINIIKDLQTLYVEMERRDCERLLANLIENGIKYNKEYGSVVIIIDPYKNQLIVKDSGVGIPQNDLSRIFERFYRGSDARVEGSGLGLAMVKHICQRYGYKINVDSKIDIGTTFTISF